MNDKSYIVFPLKRIAATIYDLFLLLGVWGIVASHPEQERGHQRCQTRLQEGSAIRVRVNDTRKLNCSSTVSSLLSTTTASSD